MDITRQAKKPVHASVPGQLSQDAALPSSLKGAAWIWTADSGNGLQVRHFRKVIQSSSAVSLATISIFAEARFHLWVNGEYISRGPAFHHPARRPLQTHDITAHWRQGRNVIAVTVFEPNLPLQTGTPTGRPGLIARVDLTDSLSRTVTHHPTDETWLTTEQTGYHTATPRRGWALGYVDVLDSSRAPQRWQSPEFVDSQWESATPRTSNDEYPVDWLDHPLPDLRVALAPVKQVLSFHAVSGAVPELRADDLPQAFGAALSAEPWLTPDGLTIDANLAANTIRIDGLSPQRGAAIVLDLQHEYTGQVVFDCKCETSGVIDIGWSELMIDGRPPLMRKRVTYADRLLAKAGENHWEPLSFSAGRYLVLILRGFTGSITLQHVGMRATEPSLSWQGHFECSDPVLNRIAELCIHTIRVGTQEGLMDCPTREQAPYLGDGHLIGRWLGLLTGDWRHWKYLLSESFARQSPEGLLRDAIFSGQRRSILDYNLLAVIATREYLRITGDAASVRDVLPACRKVFNWFENRREGQGLIDTSTQEYILTGEWESEYDPESDSREWAYLLFVDHPGLGWHNVGEPGIDRRGLNTAINAIYLVAKNALLEIERALGEGDDAEDQPLTPIGEKLRDLIFDKRQSLFSDGYFEGKQLPQISQQTNLWCLWAGLAADESAKAVMQKLFDDSVPNLARCGPYFFAYALPLMAKLGLHREAIEQIKSLWLPMVNSDATTLWETFSGDDLDSRCHPWSAAPIEFLLCDVLGLRSLLDASAPAAVQPRFDLLERASGTMMTSRGAASMKWHRTADGIHLSGELPAGVTAHLQDPAGNTLAQITGKWEWRGEV